MSSNVTSKTVLTTGEVAKICSVAPRTVSKWFDSGQLRGYRIPGSKDRRIPLEHLVRFMRAHDIPLDGLETGRRRLLILDADRDLCAALHKTLGATGDCDVEIAESAFEGGAAAREFKPHVLLVDVTLPDVNPRSLSRFCRSVPDLQSTFLIGMASAMTDGAGQALLQDGFDGFLSKPFEVRALIDLIEALTQDAPARPGV